MKEELWKFTDDNGTFISTTACRINTLYFPLCNTAPVMSSVSPDLHGDLKTDYNSFLLEPVSRLGLSNLKSSRNFWIYIDPDKIWSATGVSKEPNRRQDEFRLQAGLLWHKVTRRNKKIGLKADIASFIPASGEAVEIMSVELANISTRTITFTPCAAIPIFARSAHNLHDHRQVTSLLQRINVEKYGVVITPTLIFDESGHRSNKTSYFVFATDEKGAAPEYIYPTHEGFCGDSGDLESPEAIYKSFAPRSQNIQGKEAMAGLKFKPQTLKPGQSLSYIVIIGITAEEKKINYLFRKFNSRIKIEKALKENKEYWQKKSSRIKIRTSEDKFDNWLRWVNIQPELRRIFGCSFLPDFDYGKGGKGWRDLWQDCLALILNNPGEARLLLINNFSGVRIDGSNATIIGKNPGEFIADRNNISRVWMDHGIWPLLTTHLYLQQTGDLKILLKQAPYFRDHQLSRSRDIDSYWNPQQGKILKTKTGKTYRGTLLEHIFVENLVQFFNVGPHNHIRLEDADWNDGLDMAGDCGESVAFSAMYAGNLITICDILGRLKDKRILLLKELSVLLDSACGKPINYNNIAAKCRILKKYFYSVNYKVSGKRIFIDKAGLITDLRKKADWMYNHIRSKEWLRQGFFNGYYNNAKQRVEGNIKGRVRMTLTGQVFPLMSGIATGEQAGKIIKNVRRYLKDKKLGGFRLNTDFGKQDLNLGRAFSFVYGDKENGAFFSHMAVMYAYALYKRGCAKEGWEVLSSLYRMSCNTEKSKIYPCLPEYFNSDGRGMYSYLTGSASWLIFTLLTQVFGIRGEYGDLLIEPKLCKEHFKPSSTISINAYFADKLIEVRFINKLRKDFGGYAIEKVRLNGNVIAQKLNKPRLIIPCRKFLALCHNNLNVLEVTLTV